MRKTTRRPTVAPTATTTAEKAGASRASRAKSLRARVLRLIKESPSLDTLDERESAALRAELDAAMKLPRLRRRHGQ